MSDLERSSEPGLLVSHNRIRMLVPFCCLNHCQVQSSCVLVLFQTLLFRRHGPRMIYLGDLVHFFRNWQKSQERLPRKYPVNIFGKPIRSRYVQMFLQNNIFFFVSSPQPLAHSASQFTPGNSWAFELPSSSCHTWSSKNQGPSKDFKKTTPSVSGFITD